MVSKQQENPGRENFHSFLSIVTFLLLPPFWFLTIPALVFSKEAKNLHKIGCAELSERFALKAKKFSVAAWIIFFAFTLTLFSLYVFIIY